MRTLLKLAVACCLAGGWSPAPADCRTSNCGQDNVPNPDCAALAAPRTLTVLATIDFIFVPDLPRVEGNGPFCVRWEADNFGEAHSSTADACADWETFECDAQAGPTPADCKWETGNLDAGEFVECALEFPADTTEAFDCRPHDIFGMIGTLRITSPIVLTVDKSAADVNLSWTGGDGGGVIPGARRFTVVRADDAAFQMALLERDPIGGAGGLAFTDAGEAVPGAPDRFYLIRHRQDNE